MSAGLPEFPQIFVPIRLDKLDKLDKPVRLGGLSGLSSLSTYICPDFWRNGMSVADWLRWTPKTLPASPECRKQEPTYYTVDSVDWTDPYLRNIGPLRINAGDLDSFTEPEPSLPIESLDCQPDAEGGLRTPRPGRREGTFLPVKR